MNPSTRVVGHVSWSFEPATVNAMAAAYHGSEKPLVYPRFPSRNVDMIWKSI